MLLEMTDICKDYMQGKEVVHILKNINLSVDEAVVQNDESFEKLVSLVETYFREGGLHVQLNHVSAEVLRAAKKDPDRYKSVRVRVSGFSAYFVGLKEAIQDDVIARTEHKA